MGSLSTSPVQGRVLPHFRWPHLPSAQALLSCSKGAGRWVSRWGLVFIQMPHVDECRCRTPWLGQALWLSMTGRKPFKPLPSKAEALVYPQITLSLLPETGPGNNRKDLAKTVLGKDSAWLRVPTLLTPVPGVLPLCSVCRDLPREGLST